MLKLIINCFFSNHFSCHYVSDKVIKSIMNDPSGPQKCQSCPYIWCIILVPIGIDAPEFEYDIIFRIQVIKNEKAFMIREFWQLKIISSI